MIQLFKNWLKRRKNAQDVKRHRKERGERQKLDAIGATSVDDRGFRVFGALDPARPINSEVAVCGFAKVGKTTTMLEGIGKIIPESVVWQGATIGDRLWQLGVPKAGGYVRFSMFGGSVLYREKALSLLFEPAKAVVYFLSTKKVNFDDEQKYFDVCLPIAQRLGKSWNDIPWLLVLNEFSRGEKGENPVIARFPDEIQKNMIRIDASKLEDKRRLWEALEDRGVLNDSSRKEGNS